MFSVKVKRFEVEALVTYPEGRKRREKLIMSATKSLDAWGYNDYATAEKYLSRKLESGAKAGVDVQIMEIREVQMT